MKRILWVIIALFAPLCAEVGKSSDSNTHYEIIIEPESTTLGESRLDSSKDSSVDSRTDSSDLANPRFTRNLGAIRANPLLKSGFYKSVAIGAGYYHYGETDYRGKSVMRMDMGLLNVGLNLGYAKGGGKIDFVADANVAVGVYTGGVLDTSNENKNGERLVMFDTNSFYHLELKGGFNLLSLKGMESTIYLQGGVGYYFNRNDFTAIERLQGYVYVPLQIEGEAILSADWVLNVMGGYNFFVLGHHHSKLTKSQFSKDLRVRQTQGFGASAYIGATYKTRSGNINAFGLKYEFWSIGASPSVSAKDYAGNWRNMYEPENVSHILTLQYAWRF